MPDQPRLRLDAVALTAFAAAGVAVAALATHPPLTGLAPLLGPRQTDLVAPVADAVGFAAALAVAGWLAVTVLYVFRRGPARLLVRAAGWAVLTAAAATGIDLAWDRLGPHPGSAFGPGGSVGAYLRFELDEHLPGPPAAIALAAVTLAGLTLAADNVVRAVARWAAVTLAAVAVALVRGNRLVEVASDRVLRLLARLRRAVADRRAKPAVPVAVPEPTPEAEPAEPIPIHSHAPPELRLLPMEDDEPEPEPIPIDRAEPLPVEEPPPPPVADEPFELPPLTLLADPDPFPVEDHETKLRERAGVLEKAFQDFGLNVKVVGIHTGPVITQYEVALETGLRLNKVTNLADDLALTLKVPSVRIVAPLPGRNTVGIEVPNDHRQTVRLKELILANQAKAAKFKLPVFLGKDVEGRPLVYDLAAMPHMLIAGRTGTGKSVCLNSVILSLLYTRGPDDCRMIMIDPKMVELSEYGRLPHLMHPVVVKPEKAEAILAWAVDKMEDRYEWLRRARVRNIAAYNELTLDELRRRVNPEPGEEERMPRRLPYIVIIVDEVGDLIMQLKKEVESHIIRLAQKSRAAGIHVILATQRPTVDVITGLIKSNMPARICFQVASRGDSMVVLDEKGAEKLLGKGDMLFLQPSSSTIVRAQGALVDDGEIERTVAELEGEPNYDTELLNVKAKDAGGAAGGGLGEQLRERDPLYEQAVEIVIREQRGSTSLLQRALGIGYGKASRFIDFMAEDGFVGPYNGSNARDVLVSPDEWQQRKQAAG
jgi:S-DNA-T family DNA segregation ATPase FtsK/SpoIIIE